MSDGNRRRDRQLIVPIILGCLTSLPQQPLDLNQVEQKYKLSFKGLPGDLVAEAGLRPQAPSASVSDLSQVGLRSIALALGLVFERQAGVSIFRLPIGDEAGSRESTALGALGQLSDDQLDQLFKTGLALDDMPPDLRDSLITAVSTSPSVASKLADSGGRALVKLAVISMVDFADSAGTHHQAPVSVIGDYFSQKALATAQKRAEAPRKGSVPSVKPTFDSDTGALDFGEGRLMKVSEAMTRAEAVFGVSYRIDRRLAADYLFLRGRFSRKGFETAVGRLTQAAPLSPVLGDPKNRLRDFLKTRLAGFAAGVPYKTIPDLDTLLANPKYTLGEFMALGQDAGRFAEAFKPPLGATMQLYPMLDVSVNGGTQDTNYILGFAVPH